MMSEYSVFKFLRFFPIPETLKTPLPELLNKKVPLPKVFEQEIDLKELFRSPPKKSKKRVTRPKNAGKGVSGQAAPICQGPLSRGYQTAYAVGGVDIEISDLTWIFGEIRLGVNAQVYGVQDCNGKVEAKKIIVS